MAETQAAAFLLVCTPWHKPQAKKRAVLHEVLTLKPDAVTIETSELLQEWEAAGKDGRGRQEGK